MCNSVIFINLNTNEYIIENDFSECERKLKLLLTNLSDTVLHSHWRRSDNIKIVPQGYINHYVLNNKLYKRIDICSDLVKYHL